MSKLLSVVSEAEALAREDQVRKLLKESSWWNREWIRRNHMIAVPVESGCHFTRQQAELLSSALAKEKIEKCLGIRTENLTDFPSCFEFPTSVEGLMAFNRECSHFNFALMDRELRFVVLCTVYDYYVVIGSHIFVQNAVGYEVAEAREQFSRFAQTYHDPAIPLSIANYYADLVGEHPVPTAS